MLRVSLEHGLGLKSLLLAWYSTHVAGLGTGGPSIDQGAEYQRSARPFITAGTPDVVTMPSTSYMMRAVSIDHAASSPAARYAQVEGEADLASPSGSRAVKLAQAACGSLPEQLCGLPAQAALHMLIGAHANARPCNRTGWWVLCAGSSVCERLQTVPTIVVGVSADKHCRTHG